MNQHRKQIPSRHLRTIYLLTDPEPAIEFINVIELKPGSVFSFPGTRPVDQLSKYTCIQNDGSLIMYIPIAGISAEVYELWPKDQPGNVIIHSWSTN